MKRNRSTLRLTFLSLWLLVGYTHAQSQAPNGASTKAAEPLLEWGVFTAIDFRSRNGFDSGSEFEYRYIRPEVTGHLNSLLSYRVGVDFAADTLFTSAYLEAHFSRQLQLRVGQFKQPFGLEAKRRTQYIDFVERPIAAALNPRRNSGVMAAGEFRGGVFAYEVGFFSGEVLGRVRRKPLREVSGRFLFNPWKASAGESSFSTGVGFSSGRRPAQLSSNLQNSAGTPFFRGLPVEGTVQRIALFGAFFRGPFSVYSEFTELFEESRAQDHIPGRLDDLHSKDWYLATSFVLTGEEKSSRGTLVPLHPVGAGGWGAWEIVLRLEKAQVRRQDQRGANREIVVGTNWWLTRHLEWKGDLLIEDTGPAAIAFQSRLQLVF